MKLYSGLLEKIQELEAKKNTRWIQYKALPISEQKGASGLGILSSLLGVVVVLVVLSTAIPVLWPLAANTTAIDAMTGTDAGTTTIQSFWPVILLVIGMGLAVGLIVYGLRKFGLMGGNGGI